MQDRVLIEIKTSRRAEQTPEAMEEILASLTSLKTPFLFIWRRGIAITLEIAVIDQMVHFYMSIPKAYETFLESQIVSQYPKTLMIKSKDYLPDVLIDDNLLVVGQMKLRSGFLYPIRSFREFKDVDPLSSLLGTLSKTLSQDKIAMQFLLIPVSNAWQGRAERAANEKSKDATGVIRTNPYAKVIQEKISHNGFKTAIRIAVRTDSHERSYHLRNEIVNSFASFNNPSGNSLILRRPFLWQRRRLITAMRKRSKRFVPIGQILNIEELATLYHFPTEKLTAIHNISWYKTILSEPPENLPIALGISEEEKKKVNFFAKTEFRNKEMIFGIRKEDRRKHMYIIGKTGTGKSTLIANMIINDIRNGEGVAVIDPHGDLCEILLDYIPSFRVNDIVYLDPSDTSRSFVLNPLEVQNPQQRELVVSGIVSIFYKLYAHTWGPRLEYILRNSLLSVIDLPDSTLLMIPRILTEDDFRAKAVEKMHDKILRSFWLNEYANMHPRLKSESISPILNKIGQFISSTMIRNILKSPKSTIDLEKIMNEGKILIFNLSQGRLGEDNAALLGAMTITKIQLAAMNRVLQKEHERRDFYLYVDEFQNFATTSFIKILSEARKYRLNLILANQYIGQIPEDVRAAIFGNAGTMMSFLVGAEDARYLAREFAERFKEEDLLALGNFQSIIKLAIEGITQSPFVAKTLPLPLSRTQNREKAIKVSKERYTKENLPEPQHKPAEPVVEKAPSVAHHAEKTHVVSHPAQQRTQPHTAHPAEKKHIEHSHEPKHHEPPSPNGPIKHEVVFDLKQPQGTPQSTTGSQQSQKVTEEDDWM